MALRQFHYVLDLSCKHQMVTAHDELVLCDGHLHIVEVVHLDESSAFYVEKAGIAQRLANVLIV